MKTKAVVTAILLDLLASLVASGLFFLFSYYSFGWRGIGTLFAAAGLLFVSAGFVRGAHPPSRTELKALLLVSPFVILYIFFIPSGRLYLITTLGGALVASLAGIYARRKWTAGRRDRACLVLGVTLGLFEIASLFGAPILAKRITTRIVDFPAPKFTAMSLNGNTVNSSQLTGRVTVLYFWSRWCQPSWQEFPKLERIYERYDSNSSVAFLAIDDTSRSESMEDARSFMTYYAPGMPAALDNNYAAAKFQIRVVPTLMILDRSWHVRLIHMGYDGSEHYIENLSKEIDALLARR